MNIWFFICMTPLVFTFGLIVMGMILGINGGKVDKDATSAGIFLAIVFVSAFWALYFL